jgi:hypothetical protein
MDRFLAAVVLYMVSFASFAHEDRILSLGADGTVAALPAAYGPLIVHVSRAPNTRDILGVALDSPRFHVRLNQCVVRMLSGVTTVQASGSWYHDLRRMPPYVTLTFFTSSPRAAEPEYYAVTFSLIDGRILGGQRAWDPWWGKFRGQGINPANKCSHWEQLALWPNNSFKPNPLRGFTPKPYGSGGSA